MGGAMKARRPFAAVVYRTPIGARYPGMALGAALPESALKVRSCTPRQQDLVGYPADSRGANDRAYIDQVDSATSEEEEPLSDPDDGGLSDLADDLRVEDEDWVIVLAFFRQTSLNSTIDFGKSNPDVPHEFHPRPSPRHQPTDNNKRSHRSLEERQDR